jgi:hypothetical protein
LSQYLLSADSYICIADRHAVFLNLSRDKYTALAPEDTSLLRPLVRGWPDESDPTDPPTHQPSNQTGTDLVRMLVREGLLTQSEASGKPAVPVDVVAATLDILEPSAPIPRVAPIDLHRFSLAWARMTLALRFLPLNRIIRRARRRKRLTARPDSFDAAEAKRLMVIYLILRPNFFSPDNACLRESLTFLEFCALYGFYPTCVFGVKMNPFAAHAWIQADRFAMTDYARNLTQYTPIMII